MITQFFNEEYEFFKYRDKDGNEIMVSLYFNTHHDFFEQYTKYYREKPSLTSLLEDATLGVIRIDQEGDKTYYIRHPHQEVFIDKEGNRRGITKEVAHQVELNLLNRIKDLRGCTEFAQIMQIVEQCREKGFGELAIYDTAVRIGAFLGIVPDRVYLHAGTREGIKVLEEKGYLQEGSHKRKSIGLNEMPNEFSCLSADEIQHFACCKKSDMNKFLDIRKTLFTTNQNAPTHIVSSTIQESMRLFAEYGDVSKVAEIRKLALSTVHRHLFEGGVLNPYDFISSDDYEKVKLIKQGNSINKTELIDKILSSTATKAAFYYLFEQENKK